MLLPAHPGTTLADRGTTLLAPLASLRDRFLHGCDGPTRPVLLSPHVLPAGGRSSGGSPLMTARAPVLVMVRRRAGDPETGCHGSRLGPSSRSASRCGSRCGSRCRSWCGSRPEGALGRVTGPRVAPRPTPRPQPVRTVQPRSRSSTRAATSSGERSVLSRRRWRCSARTASAGLGRFEPGHVTWPVLRACRVGRPGATQERRRDVLRGGSNRALGHRLQAWR